MLLKLAITVYILNGLFLFAMIHRNKRRGLIPWNEDGVTFYPIAFFVSFTWPVAFPFILTVLYIILKENEIAASKRSLCK